MTSRQSVSGRDIRAYLHLIAVAVLSVVIMGTASAQTSRIKRISLMTPDLDRSIAFFTEVIGFTLDFEGTLPPGGEPFLGPVFNIDASQANPPCAAVNEDGAPGSVFNRAHSHAAAQSRSSQCRGDRDPGT